METPKNVSPIAVGLVEAAKMIGLAPRTLRKYAAEHRVRSVKLGNRLLFRVVDLENLLIDNERPAREMPRPGKEVAKALSQASVIRDAMRGPIN